MASKSLALELERALEADTAKNTQEAVQILQHIVAIEDHEDEAVKIKEHAIYKLGEIYSREGRPQDLRDLLKSLRQFFGVIPKAKTAKIVRTIIDQVGQIKSGTTDKEAGDLQIKLCTESIAWAEEEKRMFLRQRIQIILASLYLQRKEFMSALNLLSSLLREVRKLDDKNLLVQIELLETRVQLALRNIQKSKAALVAARTAANAIYCPPLLQAEIDMLSGILHAEEKDYKTGYSYFYECFEGYNSLDDPNAVLALKYMLLCKIMTNQPEDISNILSGKNALKYTGSEVDAMRAVATAYQNRSLHTFEDALRRYKKELMDDPLISTHLSGLYDQLLEQHLVRIIEPFSRVEISHIASLIGLELEKVERKLSQMILDKSLNGILDQGAGCLIVFEEQVPDKIYPTALESIESMNTVVDSLFERARILNV